MSQTKNENLTFHGKLTFKEFKIYNIFHSRKAQVVMFVVSFFAAFFMWSTLRSTPSSFLDFRLVITSILFGVIGVFMLYTVTNRQARKHFYSESFMKLKQSYTVNKDGIILETERSKANFQWSDVISAHELESLFLVYVAKAKAMVIPKRYFETDQDISKFKSFLTTELESKKVKLSAEGKEVSVNHRLLATMNHVFALITIPVLNFTITFLYWFILKYNSKFLNHHGKQSINFQLSFSMYGTFLFLFWVSFNLLFQDTGSGSSLLITFITVAVGIVMVLFYIITIFVAMVASLLGKEFRYPLTVKF